MLQGKVYTVTMDEGQCTSSSKCELVPKHSLSFIQKVGKAFKGSSYTCIY